MATKDAVLAKARTGEEEMSPTVLTGAKGGFVYSGRGNRLIRGLGLALKRLQAESGEVVASVMGGGH